VWVVVLIALGLLLGFLVRVVLQKRVTVGDARARAATVAGELERHLARTPDKVFADTVKPVLVKLREALDGDDGEAMTAEAATATEALKGATAGLQTRVTHTHARLRTFQIIAADASALPPELAQVVRHASEVCARAADHLDRLDPTRAADALDALEPALTGETASALARWRTMLPSRLGELEALGFALQVPSSEELSKALADLRTRIDAVDLRPDISRLAATLDAVRGVQTLAAARTVWAKDTLARDVADFETLFISRNGAPDAVTGRLRQAASRIETQLAASAAVLNPLTPLYDPAVRGELASAFAASLDVVFDRHKDTLKPEERKAFDEARAAHRHRAALAAVPPASSRLKQEAEQVTPALVFAAPAPPAPAPAPSGQAPVVPLEPIATIQQRARVTRDRAARAQTAIAGVLITWLGYVLFADSFVGTLKDLATVFLWGFTLDISVTKLLEMAAPFGARTPQA
jgi:hypothetical protein